MNTTTKRRGRKQKPYQLPNGDYVNGLRRRPLPPKGDGRWVIIATGEMFTEPDELKAISRFRQWEARQQAVTHAMPITGEVQDLIRFQNAGDILELHDDDIDGQGKHLITSIAEISEDALYQWMAKELTLRPLKAAQATGIEALGYLPTLKPLPPSPTLKEVGDLYFNKAKITDDWLTQTKLFWKEFCDCVQVATLRDITQEAVATFKEQIENAAKSPTYVSHRYGAIKTVINYAKIWGKWTEDRVKALAFCDILIPPEKVAMAPKPISVTDFQTLLANADDTMAAILLLGLNCCMYGKEVSDLLWSDINFETNTMIMDRAKTKVPRVAVLWPRTIKALKKLPRLGNQIFITDATKQPHNGNTVRKAFKKLAKATKLNVTMDMVRDAAFTTPANKGVQFDLIRILAGHRTGQSDHYIKRSPQLVAPVVQAIESVYFGV